MYISKLFFTYLYCFKLMYTHFFIYYLFILLYLVLNVHGHVVSIIVRSHALAIFYICFLVSNVDCKILLKDIVSY
jgi:hypothetical protein